MVVTVRDNGPGIAEEDLKRVFEPYFTTMETGHGLGLATCYSIVQKHRGHIEVSSRVGGGATFTILLPASLKSATACSRPDTGSVMRFSDLTGRRILVMDDQQEILHVSSSMLSRMGMLAETASSTSQAIEVFASALEFGNPFDAVMVDLTIPGGRGDRISGQQILCLQPDACVICTSGYTDDPVMSDYARFGFKGAIAKPFTYDELQTVVQNALQAL